MSRNDDGLPMLPPWLSESEVTQVGYEAPVQNLPHDDLIEETSNRRRGRFKNRAPEADRPEKRRKGWRRDKQDGHPGEEQRPNDQGRAHQPGPEAPPRDQPQHGSWQQPVPEQAPPQNFSWEGGPQQIGGAQHGLPTRNPSQPSAGFQPLGSRAAEPQAPNGRSAPHQTRRPDLPPPPPLPDSPQQALGEQPGQVLDGESTGPSTHDGGPSAATGERPAGTQHGEWPPARPSGDHSNEEPLAAGRPNQWPTTPPGERPISPIGGHSVAPPVGEDPFVLPTGADRAMPPQGPDPAVPPMGPTHATPPVGDRPATPTTSPGTPPGAVHPAGPPMGPSRSEPQESQRPSSTTWQTGDRPAMGADRITPPTDSRPAVPVPENQPAPSGDWSTPPFGGEDRTPTQADSSVTPPISDPPAVSPVGERPSTPPTGQATAPTGPPSAATGGPAAAGSGGPPPWWLAAPSPEHGAAPEAAAQPNAESWQSGGTGSANPPRIQPDIAASGWTSSTASNAASARPVAKGRHRLPAEEIDQRPGPQTPGEQPPNFDQQQVPQPHTDPARKDADYASEPHAPNISGREHPGHAPQFAGDQTPGGGRIGPHGPAEYPNTGPAESTGQPAQFVGGPAPVNGPAPVGEPAAQLRNTAGQGDSRAQEESGRAAPYPGATGEQYQPEPQGYAQPAPQTDGSQRGNPPGYAQPHAQQPNYQPSAQYQQPFLDNVPRRQVKRPPGSGWRKAVHHVSGGAINPGMSAEERRLQELVARIRQPVRGDYRIAVLSLKGGVGKTTTTMGIGSIFASIRGDRVIAVDANPDFGTLSQRVPLQTRSTVRDLLLDPSIQRYSDVRRHTSQSTSRLEVLASERDPAASEAFSEEEYRAVARILQRFYNIILTDCGTGLMHSAMSGVLDLAHSLVLISSPAIDGARSAAATLDWLSLHGHDHLVRNAVVVINSPRSGSPNVGIQQLREYFLSRCRAVHIIPFDPHMSVGAEIDLHQLNKQTKRAYVELAATVADDFATDHRRYRP
ncbi:AAA family ATPase [Nocardia sp. NBC_01730]|uniref:MinD/ParA family ATP-binding protein n=1 Tax=Nocardia sp. NBC_01730 TaxID=2975998 RepID=UPI002E0E3157|nr:AAA family ATPase [Nocardia sp. NBC_01730]